MTITLVAYGDLSRIWVERGLQSRIYALLGREWILRPVENSSAMEVPAPPHRVAEVIREFLRQEQLPVREDLKGRIRWDIVLP